MMSCPRDASCISYEATAAKCACLGGSCAQPAASSATICKKYYGEVLQRWQLRHKRQEKAGSDRKHVEAAARRASLRQAERERLKKQMQLVEKANGKRQELLESKCAQAQQSLEARTLDARNRRTEQQEGLKMKLLEHFKKSARCLHSLVEKPLPAPHFHTLA
ncbi:hypothetical protein Emag_001926 [Eimeria magna]